MIVIDAYLLHDKLIAYACLNICLVFLTWIAIEMVALVLSCNLFNWKGLRSLVFAIAYKISKKSLFSL